MLTLLCIGHLRVPFHSIEAMLNSSNKIQLDASVSDSALVTLILKCKGISEANPGSCKAVLYGCGFAKIPSGAIILLGT